MMDEGAKHPLPADPTPYDGGVTGSGKTTGPKSKPVPDQNGMGLVILCVPEKLKGKKDAP